MPVRDDKKTLQGQVQPWACDFCQAPFQPDLKGICSRCGRLCCPGHRKEASSSPGLRSTLCSECSGKPEKEGGGVSS